MLFFLKKLIGGLLMPLPMFILAMLVAVLLCWRNWRRSAFALMALATLALYALSTPIIATALLSPLEQRFPAYQGQKVDAVIVLGGYHRSKQNKPISALLSPTSMVRLSEGMRIQGLNPSATLNLSGYKGTDEISNAEAMARVAIAYGVDEAKIYREPLPKDTAEEARTWAKHLAGQRVALVTSASHMPRAMYLFEQAGMSPLAAPTNQIADPVDLGHWRTWFPSAQALVMTSKAWHEYLGLAWARLRA